MKVLIKQPNKDDIKTNLVSGVYRVGASPASHLQFEYPEISNKHAQFIVKNDILKVADVGSSNGTFIDNRRIDFEAIEVKPGSIIKLGFVTIQLLDDVEAPTPQPVNNPVAPASQVASSYASINSSKRIDILKVSNIPASARPLVQEIKKRAHHELMKRLNLKRMAVSGTSDEDLRKEALVKIKEILSELTISLPAGVELSVVENELVHEAIGLGPLEDLLAMEEITEVMVNGPNSVYVEYKGNLLKTDTAFADDNQVLAAIERIVAPLGRRIDESSPMVDARLPDGSRVNAIIPPLSLVGPSITIRKFSKIPLTVQNLIDFKSISPEVVKFLDVCVQVRKNIIISGGTGSGKTTLLNVMSSFLPSDERIVTIEDAAELQLKQDHVVRLESRPPNIEGRGEVAIRDLVRNSLRMRPDRIVIGECRGGEALDMLQAMNTGHDGSLTTIHANTPRDALARLETLVLMAGFDLPLRAIREQIASAITIIVQISRDKDGSRRVLNVSEITKMEGEIITLQDIFEFKQTGWDENEKIIGTYEPTGAIPTFMEEIKRAKLDLDISMFTK